ncbi:MAG: TonB-dependent receptor, partial [Gemmatimonadota bacterium]|nr:TonB-dependent receptor [Gemmatimonadota bacterium]
MALAAPITTAQAQTGKLTGVVTDAETGKPVEGVSVVIQGTTLGSNTNASGRYFIIQVPPGSYSVQARRLGFQSVTATNVTISIDATREQNFKLRASNQTLAAVTVQADVAPLVERGQVGSRTTVTAEQITSLPVTSIAGVLALQQGFTEVPQNTSVVSLAEEQRSTTPQLRVRGSRGGATLSMIDGIAINNPLFGNDAVSMSALAVQQVDFQRGAMEPQYGNALAGVINQAVREGGSEVSGAIDFQNSTLPGNIFNTANDKLLGLNLLRGYLSGPVPGTRNKVRYSVSGQVQSQAQRVLEFDNDAYTANAPVILDDILGVSTKDLSRGFQSFGGTQNSSVVGKLTFLPFDNTTIKVTAVGSERQNRGYDRR